MFEVGVKEAGNQLTDLERRLKKLVSKYGSLQIKVEVTNLEKFIRTLETIGNGKQLEPLLRRIDVLHSTLAVMGTAGAKSMQDFEAATKVNIAIADQYRKRIEELTKARDVFQKDTVGWRKGEDALTAFKTDKATMSVFAMEKQAIDNLAEAKTRLVNEEKKEGQSAGELNSKIEQLSQSISNLSSKTFSVNMGSEFKTWAEQVQLLVAQVKELVNQMTRLHQVQGQGNAAAPQGGLFDPQKFATLQEAIDKIIGEINRLQQAFVHLGENNSLSSLSVAIKGLAVELSNLGTAIKLQPVDEQVKQLLADNEKLKQKLMEVAEAGRYINVRNGEKTQDKTADVLKLAAGQEKVNAGLSQEGKLVDTLSIKYASLIAQIENTQASLSKLLARGGNSQYLNTQIKDAIKGFQALKEKAVGSEMSNEGYQVLTASLRLLNKEYTNVTREAGRFSKEVESNMKQAENEARKLTVTISNLEALSKRAGSLGIDTSKLDSVISELKMYKQTMDNIASGKQIGTNVKKYVISDWFLETKRNIKDATSSIKKDMRDALKPDTSLATAFKEYASIVRQITSLTNTANKADKFGIDTNNLRQQIALLEKYKDIVESFIRAGGHGFSSWASTNIGYINARNTPVLEQQQINAKIAEEKQRNAAATNSLTAEEQRLAQAIGHSNGEMRSQSQVLSDLKMMATQYLSVWGAQSFLRNIIEIGGQLEKQRLSIGAILQDMAHGEDLFDKIKRLAVQSPFGVVELDQFTKQLSAYGFKYNELYDMTKRLADISAGAGTEVSRLALALGHVRAEGALSGYTLRQFAMNNIPMVSELAKKLSEVEGHLVTTADVRKRVSNKEIGYKDVEDVIKKLTNEGGMFYRMQEVISESVQARFKNLRDSFDIMYGEIAKSSIGDILKDIASVLTRMSREWKSFIPIIQASGVAFAAYRLALLATNMTMGKNTASTLKNILAQKQKIAADLQQVSVYKTLNSAEKQIIANQNALTASDLRAAMSSGAMTKAEALKLVALRKLTIQEAAAAVNMGLFSEAEVMAARNSSLLVTRIKLLGTTLKTSLLSALTMVFNAWTVLFAALAAGMSMYQKQEQYNEDRKARNEELWLRSREGQKNLREMTATYKVGLSAELNDDGLKQAISDLKEKLKDYAPDVNKIFNEAFAVDTSGKYRKNVKSLAEQYEILAKALENTERAYTRLTTVRYAVDDAVEATQVKDSIFGVEFNNPFDNNVVENIKKYAEAFGEADKAMMAFMRDYHDEVQRGLAAAGMRFLSTDIEGMEEAVKKLRIDDISDASMWSKFTRSIENNEGAKEAFESYKKSMAELREQWNATSNDIMTMGNRLFKNLTTRWGSDISKWTTDQKMAVYMVFDDIIGKEMEAAGVTEEEQKKMRSLFMEPFGIEFRTETEAAYEEINELKEYLESITDKAWVIKLKVESSDSVDIIDQARKLRKAAKEGVEELGKDLKKAGLGDAIGKDGSVELGKAKTPAEERMLKDYSKKVQEKLNAEKTLDAYHAAYEDEKKKKDKGRSSGEDKEAKKLREIAKLYKDAYNWYKKYEKQVGEGGALTKVKEQFQPLFDQFNKEWGTNLRIDSIPLYRQNLEDLLSKAQAYYETPAHRNNYMVDAIKEFRDAISDVDYSEAERKMDKFASDMTRQLDELTRKWEIFNSVRESTGDDALAKRLTGITPGATPADIKRLGISQMVSVPIDFDEVLKKSDEQIDEYVEGLGLAQDQLKGVKEKLKDWKKAQEDVEKNDIINYAKWLGSLVELQSIRNRNQGEYNRILEETNRLLKEGQITPEEADRRRKAAQGQRDYKDWTATAIYSDLYNNAQVMAKVDFDEAFAVEMEHLKARFKNGTITLQEYSDKVANLNQIASEFSSRGFLGIHGGLGALLSGGTQGLSKYYRQKAAQAYKRGDDEEGDKYEKMAKSLEKQQKAAEQVVKAFQDLAAGADLLGNLFSSMGWEGGANAMSDASGILNGAVSGASSLSFLGPYGMAAGAALGVVSGIFALHDKSLQRQIDALKENNAAIEANTDAIKKARERTLGYDAGQLRKAIANIYNNMGDSDAKNAMREYYMTNGSGTGYRQELANLKAERENYIEMYNLEADKKNESSEALMEYKQKIAELDDQIAYFAEDLSNELFSIDLKGWASQIGDALMTAFENGEDAAEAFKDTVKDIMRSVLNKMLTIGILEPMMENLRKKLFGENGKGGVFDANNPEGTIDAAMQEIAAFFGEGGEGQQMIQATETFYKRWQEFMRSKGLTLDDESSSSASGSIKSITEQTGDLLASYLNATRASTAKIEYLSAQYFPMYFAALTSGNASLRNIETQTAAIMRSNDVIADKITSLDNNINGLKNKTWKVPMA